MFCSLIKWLFVCFVCTCSFLFDQVVTRKTTSPCGSSARSTRWQESPRTSTKEDTGRPRSRATGTPARISSDPNHAHAPWCPHCHVSRKITNNESSVSCPSLFPYRSISRHAFSLSPAVLYSVDSKGHRNDPGTLSRHIHCVSLCSPRVHWIIKV